MRYSAGVAIFVILMSGLLLPGPPPSNVSGLNSVPAALRASLLQHLNLLVKFQTKRQWANFYDLLASTWTYGKPKAQFVKEAQYPEIRAFKLDDIEPDALYQVKDSQGEWALGGCSNTPNGRFAAVVYADLVAGEWKLSPILIYNRIDAPSVPCS